MTYRQREICRLESEIARLQKRVDILKAMEDNSLRIEDINFYKPALRLRYTVGNDRFKALGEEFATVDELTEASPKEILKLKGWGKASLKKLEEWMKENSLTAN